MTPSKRERPPDFTPPPNAVKRKFPTPSSQPDSYHLPEHDAKTESESDHDDRGLGSSHYLDGDDDDETYQDSSFYCVACSVLYLRGDNMICSKCAKHPNLHKSNYGIITGQQDHVNPPEA